MRDVRGDGFEPSFAVMLEVLFDHVPGSGPTGRITADEVCQRSVGAPRPLSPPVLSSLRRGRTRDPKLTTVQATAVGFGVDIAFFTTSFHHRHRRHPMPVRVVLASNGWHDYYRMAAALYDLHHRNARSCSPSSTSSSTTHADNPPPRWRRRTVRRSPSRRPDRPGWLCDSGIVGPHLYLQPPLTRACRRYR